MEHNTKPDKMFVVVVGGGSYSDSWSTEICVTWTEQRASQMCDDANAALDLYVKTKEVNWKEFDRSISPKENRYDMVKNQDPRIAKRSKADDEALSVFNEMITEIFGFHINYVRDDTVFSWSELLVVD